MICIITHSILESNLNKGTTLDADSLGVYCGLLESNLNVSNEVNSMHPLKEEPYAKSGQLLKKTVMSDIKKIDDRWHPTTLNYKDMLKDGKGTDCIGERDSL